MVVFWLLATAMTAVALAFVLVPLLRARAPTGPSEAEANLEVLRSQRQEIEADLAAGTLPASARDEALAELVGRAADDLSDVPPPPSATERKPWIAAAVAGLAVPALAFGVYLALGTPAATDSAALARAGGMPADDHQVAELVDKLAAKVRERPDDAQGWSLLARSMAALERWPEAAEAYAHLVKLVPGDATVLADYADVLGMAQGRTLAGRPVEIARQALEIDPKHQKALALLASAAMDAGDARGALGYWERLAEQLPPGSQDAREVAQIIEELRAQAGPALAAGAPRIFEKPGPPPPAQPPAPAGKSVTGTVTVSPAVRAKVAGNETVYIFARSEGGPRTPLAVLRLTAKELPIRFALDDSQAMAPGMNISSAQAVRVEARITRTGDATPKPGDLVGTSPVVKPGARDVEVVVDKVVP